MTKKKSNSAKKSNSKKIIAILLLVVVLIGIGFYVYKNYDDIYSFLQTYFHPNDDVPSDDGDDTLVYGDLSIHFLDLNTKNTGDCVLIKVGDVEIIVDSGPDRSSSSTIYNYLSVQNNFVTDGKIEYMIATHADQDHIAGFAGSSSHASLFERYQVDTIIDFPLTNKSTVVYQDYIQKRDAKVQSGTKHFSALECYNQSTEGAQRKYQLSENIELEILYNYYYENTSGDENNYSVCFMINQGSRHFLFTGDLEEDGEARLVQNNTLPQVELFKAGHHGSKTSSNQVLLQVIQPKICVVTCVAGSSEYTNVLANMFPTQIFIDNIANYTTKVYIPSVATIQIEYEEDGITPKTDRYGYTKYKIVSFEQLNGNIVISSTSGQDVMVNCSNNNTVLKDTQWFKSNRTCPSSWQEAA